MGRKSRPFISSGHQPGWFLVTVVTPRRRRWFGHVIDATMHLSDVGIVASTAWEQTATRTPGFDVRIVQFMPDHLHAVIHLGEPGGRLGQVLRQFKARATIENRRAGLVGAREALWVPGFHVRRLRTQDSVHRAVEYVRANPENWPGDGR